MTTADVFRIRPALVEETGTLQEIELDAAQLYLNAPGHEFCPALGVRSEAEHARARREGAALVAVGADEQPVGFALVIPLDGTAHLLELAVARRSQRRGAGRALLSAVDAWATGRGFAEVTLTTFRDVPWNAPAYARFGYQAFEPPPERAGLRAVIAEERRSGVARAPRVAMRKRLTGG